jgi:hypothetical protein
MRLQTPALKAAFENASLPEDNRFMLGDALCGLRNSQPKNASAWTFGMFDDVVHCDLREIRGMQGFRPHESQTCRNLRAHRDCGQYFPGDLAIAESYAQMDPALNASLLSSNAADSLALLRCVGEVARMGSISARVISASDR